MDEALEIMNVSNNRFISPGITMKPAEIYTINEVQQYRRIHFYADNNLYSDYVQYASSCLLVIADAP